MAITAATRTDIIELVVTAYDAAPGTTLLTELVAIVDGGGTLADVAANLTTRTEWTSKYPSFQTAEEFADEWLGKLVPEASATALAEAKTVAVGLINGGTSFGAILLEAQTFLSALAETDASFGTSAALFNNKTEVATYYTVTKEQADLGSSTLSGVTSADSSVTTANAAVDTSAKPDGLSISLTTGLDSALSGSEGDDTFTAVETAVTSPVTDQLNAGDSITGGDGTDKLVVSASGTPAGGTTAGVVTTGVEQVSMFNNSTAAYTLDANLMTGVTDLFVNGGTFSTTFSNVQSTPNLHLLSTNVDATVTLAATAGLGAADAVTILSNNSAATGDVTATYNGVETVNLSLAGATGNASLGYELTLSTSDLETLNITGASSGNIITTMSGNDGQSMTNTVDASAATGNNTVAVTRGAGSSKTSITMGSGDDHVIFSSATSELDTIVGGAGTDTIELSSDEDYGTLATAQDDLSGISGFEVLRLQAGVDIDGRNFTNNSGLTKLVVESTGSIDYSEVVTVDHLAAGTATVDLTTDGSADTLAYNMNVATAAGIATTLAVTDYETINVASAGTTGTNTLTISGATNDVTTVNVSGTQSASVTVAGTSIATVDASGLTGLGESFTLSATASTAAMTVTPSGVTPSALTDTANTITTGSGADTITGTTHEDNLSGGSGNDVIDGKGAPTGATDTLTGGAGNDSITGGSGADSISDGAGNDTVVAGDGIDTITVGAGNDSIDGGAGNDTITGGENVGTSDTIAGGAGTDTLTLTLASVGQIPTISGVENIYSTFSTSTFLDAANITDISTLRVEAGSTGAAAQVKNLATGATVTVTDDATLGGTAGNITTVTIDSVASATTTLKIDDNNNAATAAASSLSTLTVTDVATLNITNTGGSSSNVLDHQITGNLVLDDTDTTALTMTSSAYGSLDFVANTITNSSNLASWAVTAASYGDITIDTLADAEKVQSLTFTASGESADINIGIIGGTTASTALQTVSMTSTSGGTIDVAAITGNGSNMDSVTYSATGTNSTVTPTGAITTTNANINSVTIAADDRGTVTATSGDLTVGSGVVSAIDVDATNRGSVVLSGFVSSSTSTVAAGNWMFDTATRGTITTDGTTSIQTDGDLSKLSVVIGSDSTLTGNVGSTLSAAGTITDTILTVASDATTSGGLVLGEVGTTHTDLDVSLDADATNGATFDILGDVFTAADITLGGSGNTTLAINPDGEADDTGDFSHMELTYDGTAAALEIFNNAATDPTITTMTVNASGSTGTNVVDTNQFAAKLVYTGGTGADEVGGTTGADSITTGAGNDTIGGAGRVETFTVGSNTNTHTFIPVINGVTVATSTATTSSTTQLATNIRKEINDDFATANVLASSATAVVTVTYGTFLGTAGAANGNGTTTVAVTTGMGGGADTIDAGAGDDTIIIGAGNDSVTTGTGTDNIIILGLTVLNTALSTAPSATSIAIAGSIANGDTITFANGLDIITDFTSGTDNLVVSLATTIFEGIAPTTLVGASSTALTEDTAFQARGDYVASTGVFTLSATGADTLFLLNDDTAADDVLSTNTNFILLSGVTSLVAGDVT
jgi:Ca2+-binding RTX toxin-like protein